MKNLPFQLKSGTATPAVPAIWPNRAIRRAIKYAKAIPTQWDIFFQQQPALLALVKTGRLPA